MALDELISRLDAATGPDGELDLAIKRVCSAPDSPFYVARHYTASIDAALTLVPDEWTAWKIRSWGRKTHFHVELTRFDETTGSEEMKEGSGPTPALALCITALKARATP